MATKATKSCTSFNVSLSWPKGEEGQMIKLSKLRMYLLCHICYYETMHRQC